MTTGRFCTFSLLWEYSFPSFRSSLFIPASFCSSLSNAYPTEQIGKFEPDFHAWLETSKGLRLQSNHSYFDGRNQINHPVSQNVHYTIDSPKTSPQFGTITHHDRAHAPASAHGKWYWAQYILDLSSLGRFQCIYILWHLSWREIKLHRVYHVPFLSYIHIFLHIARLTNDLIRLLLLLLVQVPWRSVVEAIFPTIMLAPPISSKCIYWTYHTTARICQSQKSRSSRWSIYKIGSVIELNNIPSWRGRYIAPKPLEHQFRIGGRTWGGLFGGEPKLINWSTLSRWKEGDR